MGTITLRFKNIRRRLKGSSLLVSIERDTSLFISILYVSLDFNDGSLSVNAHHYFTENAEIIRKKSNIESTKRYYKIKNLKKIIKDKSCK